MKRMVESVDLGPWPIHIGDRVRLAYGGPVMVVAEVYWPFAQCMWRLARRGPGPGLRRSDRLEDFFARVQNAAILATRGQRPYFKGKRIVIIATAHFTKHSDALAASTFVQDALEGIVYSNDSQVMFAGSWRGSPSPDDPRTNVLVFELGDRQDSLSLPVPKDLDEGGAPLPRKVTRLRPSVRRFE